MSGINSESAPSQSRSGVELGRIMFRSFLLAGERFVTAGLARPGTDEARVAQLISSVPSDVAKSMEGYFRRQAALSLSQRTQLLGHLTSLTISEPLTLATTTRPLMSSIAVRSELATVLPSGFWGGIIIPRPVGLPPKPAPRPGLLRLRLEELKVDEAQDDYYIWIPFYGRKYYNQTDEVSLGVMGIDETGDVASVTHNLGSITEGKSKTWSGMDIFSFSVAEGGSNYPKVFNCQIYAVEGDSGGWNRLISAATEYAQSKSREMVTAAIVSGSTAAGAPIHPTLAATIATAVDSYVDDFIGWLSGLLRNDDDVLGSAARSVRLLDPGFTWGGATGSSRSAPWTATFSGSDGRWTARFHWLLEETAAIESPMTQAS